MRLSIDAGFIVQELTIRGAEQLSTGTVAELVAIRTGDPMLIVDPDEIAVRLLEHPWIRQADITRHFPNHLEVSIVERQPMTLWQHDGRISLIDREGAELPYAKLSDHADLIVLAGQDAPRQAAALLALLATSPGVAKRVRGATWVSGRRWNLHLDNGIEIRLPRDDPERALRDVATAHDRQGLFERDILAIDARDPTRISMRLSTHAAEERRASRN